MNRSDIQDQPHLVIAQIGTPEARRWVGPDGRRRESKLQDVPDETTDRPRMEHPDPAECPVGCASNTHYGARQQSSPAEDLEPVHTRNWLDPRGLMVHAERGG